METITNLLQKLKQKEQRAKDAYMDGIDTLEEYKHNKILLAKERDSLEASLEQLRHSRTNEEMHTRDSRMIKNIRSVIDILSSDDFTMFQKNAALKSIVSKIVFNRETMHIDVYYYLAENPETRIK